MRRLIPILLLLAGCTAPLDADISDDTIDGKADRATAALEGTREGYGVLRLLNDREGTTFELLDDDASLDRRAAANLIEHRDGADTFPGTRDDDLYDSIEEVDDVRWVGESALSRLAEFAALNDYVPGPNQVLGTFDGVELTYEEGERVVGFANRSSAETLSDAGLPSRAVTSILEARPLRTVAQLAALYFVGPRSLEYLLDAVTTPAGGEACETTTDCSDGFRCTGRPEGFSHGRCRVIANYAGYQDPCAVDADCVDDGVCIAESVYGSGYCADPWMRDSFSDGGMSSIPSVVMSSPTGHRVTVYGQATVPEDIFVDIDIEHSDPSSLWIGLEPPTGQEPVTLWDGATMAGPLPSHFVDRGIYRDDAVNGVYRLLIQNVGGRGEGTLRGWTLTVSSRWD